LSSSYTKSQIKALLQTDKAKSFHISLNAKLALLPNASVPLYQSAGRNYKHELIGTGFPLEIGSHRMLVTAGHVTGLLQSKHFCVPQSGEIKPLNCRISRFGHADVPLAADSIDVSIIHLTERQADDLSAYHFVQLSEIEYETVLHDPQGYDAFMGYPASKNKKKLGANGIKPKLFPYVGVQIQRAELEQHNRPFETHLGIEFGTRVMGFGGNIVRLPDPKGTSGCPVWSLGKIGEIAGGSRKTQLVGICIERKGNALIAVRAWLILQVVREAFPDLAGVIEQFPNVQLRNAGAVPQRQLILNER